MKQKIIAYLYLIGIPYLIACFVKGMPPKYSEISWIECFFIFWIIAVTPTITKALIDD